MGMAVQVAGSLAILTAFVLAQFGRLDGSSYPYLVLNLVGSVVLSVDAFLGEQWGFLLLEFVWAVVSAIGLVKRLRGQEPAAAH
jgi:hypothetical protein